jgi:hypothetical protein
MPGDSASGSQGHATWVSSTVGGHLDTKDLIDVDTRTEARIQKSLLRLMAGRTVCVIAHRQSTIRDADEILVIRDCEIVE